jgi:hypothetical protein
LELKLEKKIISNLPTFFSRRYRTHSIIFFRPKALILEI